MNLILRITLFTLLAAAAGCASMAPSEVQKLTYDSPLKPLQVYQLFTDQCGSQPKDIGWTNGPGNGFGIDAKFDDKTNSGTIVYYHISFGTRSEPGSFWDRTFGQTVRIAESKGGSHIELRGETAAHLMKSKYKSIGELLNKSPKCGF